MAKVSIIGAGIAGLTAGIYARRSGFDVTIYESHIIAGGNCTSWRREGYFFEGGMHWLTGSSEKKPINRIWREVGAINTETRIFNTDPFLCSDCHGERIFLYRDMDRFQNHLCSVSPEDTKQIKKLFKDIKRFHPVSVPVMDIPFIKTKNKTPSLIKFLVKIIPALPRMLVLDKISIKDFVLRFRHPAIRFFLSNLVDSDYDATSLLFTLACFTSGDGGYVEGGALKMAQNMAESFIKAGGIIRYKTKIDRVVVKGNRIYALQTGNEIINTDSVIISSDTLMAETLFDEGLRENWLKQMRRKTALVVNTFITLGVAADLSSLPAGILCALEKPFDHAGITVDNVTIRNYSGFEKYAPPGSTAMTVLIMGDTYDYWKQAKEDGLYEQCKQELVNAIVSRLEEQYPLIKGKAVFRDAATPLTYERYCGTYHGSWMTKTLPGQGRMAYPFKSKTIRGLYFAGQRIQPPGGLPGALVTGRTAAQYLCRDFHIPFC
ncbi:MAG: NAD(P)/FAD-dependent oxidoreductase [Treponema sp.]|jgi:phytoene dehydrogenase-like protein|nr:NAD(P)/FAD-dependent oxidoreductase [Treponema sp.]